jgi:hypothetical protein
MNDLYISGSDYKGLPVYFCLYDGQIRLHPIPDDAYTLTMYYNAEPDELSAAGSNVWTTGVQEELIRREAAAEVAATVLLDDKRASINAQLAQNAIAQMKRENTMRLMSGYSRKRRC